ncbi:type VI secretion system protein TssA [Novipirellula artificiosorum]|uniref:ImpA N-terminal domain-containing protein n=1 Tax=Novipirellula artificiosorum TaxID=2528016 RepID=A0A5C6D7W7_9BACT|nr:type VI secretion system protein TssA [Novipirellula artificiosorum]TWU31944.1 hypothetical protein Poly41_58320 [Novipirellula artificiosorum]
MASEPTLDLDRLTAAISEEHPAGTFLRETNRELLQRAKDSRSAAVAVERRQRELEMYSDEDLAMLPDEDRRVESPDWRTVVDCCTEILANHSKDLWVASWLIEANTRLAGFAGLRDGFQLVVQLVEKYWDNISPPPDEEEGYAGTLSQLASLNGVSSQGTLIIPIESIPLLVVNDSPGLSFAAYRQAMKDSDARPSEAEFYSAARKIDPQRLRQSVEEIDESIEAFSQMNRLLASKCGAHDQPAVSPPSSQITAALEQCQRTLRLISRDVVSPDSAEESEPTDDDSESLTQSTATSGRGNVDPVKQQVANREDAFRMLLQASEFFRKTEPHSPVGYMLQKAVRIGRMELPDLLQEMITDEDVLVRFAERTGIDIKRDSEED